MVLKASRWPALELRWDSSELRRERRRSILALGEEPDSQTTAQSGIKSGA